MLENICTLKGGISKGLYCKDVISNKLPDFLGKSNVRSYQVLGASSYASRSNSESIKGAPNKLVVESTISSQEELSNITKLADAESRKGGKGNKKGTAEFNHGRFQRQRKGVYELGQYALSSAIAAAKIRKTARKGKMKFYFATKFFFNLCVRCYVHIYLYGYIY